MLSTPFGEECIACLTRGQLDVGCWLIPQPAMQKADFGAALGPQPMIHGQRTNLSMPLSCPAMRQNGEG